MEHFPFVAKRRVEFCQTDAGGIMHFACFFQMMEQVEHEMLRDLGLSVMSPSNGGHLSWPRVSAHCDFQKPARFEEVVHVHFGVSRIGARSVTYRAEFRIGDDLIARGTIVAVCCLITAGDEIRSMDIPPEIAAKLAKYQVGELGS